MDDAIAVDDDDQEEKPLEQSSTTYGDLGTAMENDAAAAAVQVQEQVVEQQDATQPRDEDTAAEGQETPGAHQPGSTENADDAVQVQEEGETADATAVHDHDKAVEQCTTADDLGTTMENDVAKDDQEVLEQGVIDQGDASTIDAVKDHEVLLLGAVEGTRATTDGIAAVEDQGKNVEQCTTYSDLGTTMKNDDASVEEQEVVEEGVVDLTMDDDDSVKHHKQQGIIDGTDDIAVEKQEKVLEQCSRATTDQYTVKEKEMVVEQGVIDPKYMDLATEDQVKLSIIDDHGAAEILELNRLGLPIREGARNCDYYMRTGACRYGKNCHFNHPDHVIDAQFSPPTGWEDNALQMEKSSDHTLDETSRMKKSSDGATFDDRSHMKKSSDDATLDDRSHLKKPSDGAIVDDTSYSKKSSDHENSSSSGVLPPSIFRMLLPPQKVLPGTEGKAKKKSDWSSDDSDGCCSADSSDGPLCKQGEHVDYPERPGRPEYHRPKQSKYKEEVNYPERPGKPDCPFYMRFGDCKFASACNYHHPKDKYPAGRPDEPECPFLMKRGYCKLRAQCKFYHPEASSPTDAKRSVTTDEHHPSTRTTLQDYMLPQQPQYPERPGQPECRYYLQFGKCKYLSACIFHHPKDRLAAHSDQIGPGMPDCPFYMKAGKCQFGSACEFRHPKDIHSSSTAEEAFDKRSGSGAYDSLTRSDNGVEQQEESIMYPERPGEPECNHYMRQGYCKFQMNCKYHHPGDRLSKKQY
ncbi:unnamed protein product [Triticum turgidum subsp. durum]|uniref:C3H1-type domain-containing protein n=1 Tax=Triticum turgidum subsp. durum TaxID=4567 RepID=A0A9R0R6I9_TRITD|nr:unnamed protein product [Triticum turgidum subsp. durum]